MAEWGFLFRKENRIFMITKVKKKSTYSNHIWKKVWRYRNVYIILLPTLLFYIIFRYIPMFGNIIAFQDYSIAKGITGSDFVGFENFISFFKSYNFWDLLRNTVLLNVYGLIFGFPAPIILALLLNEVRCKRFKKAAQTITYMPHFISVVVAVSMVLTFLSSDGLFNVIRQELGMGPLSFMTEPKYFRSIFTLAGIWQNTGFSSIVYLAALSGVDQELYEAAKVDGAGRWKQLLHVTLPGIAPTIIIMLIMRIGQMLSIGYEKIILMYNPTIYETADVISTYVYRRGLLDGDYGFATAVGMFNSLINLLLLITANRVSKKMTETALW